MPRRFKLTLAYQGTAYHGWQTQANAATVQATLEAALARFLHERPALVGASRTDAGVHALGQVAHFDSETTLEPFRISEALNAHLPPDIKAIAVEEVPLEFHAQKSVIEKSYRYYFYSARIPYPFWETYAWQIVAPLDLAAMGQAAQSVIGTHNFSAFCAADSTAKTFTREVTHARIAPLNDMPFLWNEMSPPLYCLHIRGKGFLKFMIRTIMGTLVEVGRGQKTIADFSDILARKDRRLAGPTAPARGLFLDHIVYD